MTLVLCAALPVNSDTLEGQHKDTVQKCFLNHVPSCLKCFCTDFWYSIESRCKSWSSVMIKMKFGLVAFCTVLPTTAVVLAAASSNAWLGLILK